MENIRRLMRGEEQVPILPWWRGYTGTIKKTGDNKYDVLGTIKKLDDTTVEITELPIHKWTQSFKAELEAMCGEKGDGVIKVSSVLSCTQVTNAEYMRIIGLQGVPQQHERPLCHHDAREGA